jgi:hypothetical protein
METVLIVTTVASVALAAGMGILAWRLARTERSRSAARVAPLADDLHEFDTMREQAVVGGRGGPSRVRQVARRAMDVDNLELRSRPGAVPPPIEMFHSGAMDRSKSRLATVLAVGSFAVAVSLALVIATGRGAPRLSDSSAAPAAAASTPAGGAVLELVALSHERSDDQITIRGVVRNPSDGERLDQLTAVVYLFEQDGSFLGTGSAPIKVERLEAGSESLFVVTAGHAATIRRYRVSFKSGERVVPHLDRRQANSADIPGH